MKSLYFLFRKSSHGQAMPGSKVGKPIVFYDEDSGQNHAFQLLSHGPQQYFSIDAATGQIYIKSMAQQDIIKLWCE